MEFLKVSVGRELLEKWMRTQQVCKLTELLLALHEGFNHTCLDDQGFDTQGALATVPPNPLSDTSC